ncbi:YihA family ribosome biogenesis GTP-binding protein [bacterium]|nr:YihA family ribosome biogenesis GTP-binding protein [bacterium]
MDIKAIEFIASVYRNHQVPEPRLSEIAFIGRSNVGKSTLLNTLTGKKLARISSTPGKTQCLNYYRVNGSFYLVDAPGYGYAKVPEKLKLAWKRFIDEWITDNDRLKLVIQIIDARLEPQKSDLQMAEWLNYHNIPSALVVNKIDKLSHSQRQENLKLLCESAVYSKMNLIPASAQSGEGKREILSVISRQL